MINIIKSKDNDKIKYTKSLLKTKGRNKEKKFIIEGYRILTLALECDAKLKYVFINEDFEKKQDHKVLLEELENKNIKIYKTSNKIFSEMVDTENTQGILAVLRYKERDLVNNINQDDKFVLILDRIQDPGNMGTIIRTADSAGVDAIILLKGCVDIYNPKVIRSTMGSIFDMNIIQTTQDEAVDFLKANNFDIVSSYLHTESYYNETTYDGKIALVIGNEANGINDELISKSDKLVKIPIYGNAESLNAAISAAILMYEIKKYLV
ncbi:MAG: TrmH family RNA methyltransferase [Intestinibacter bartlettii]|uniref:TrmH family RNA methyltransferase n=1 Tax=Intestinibacter bartlettii TaxID=261299 RepID=UPI0026DBCB51|nr:RNA methyltransferase [Intestinibacter bartlettii]